MTAAVQQLLESFDLLSSDEKREAAQHLLLRILRDVPDDVSDETLAAVADRLFVEIDRLEDADKAFLRELASRRKVVFQRLAE